LDLFAVSFNEIQLWIDTCRTLISDNFMKPISLFLLNIILTCFLYSANAEMKTGVSFDRQKPDDPEVVCFNNKNFKISAEGKGNQTGIIRIPERPSTLAFGGKDKKTLFITGRTALYSVEVK
jgi:hypothetical protein